MESRWFGKVKVMSDLISRQAAIELIERMKSFHQDADDILEMVDNMPSAEPVRHGKWVEYVDDRWGASHYFCSECGNPPLKEERTNRRCLSTFCPNCGADMRGEK